MANEEFTKRNADEILKKALNAKFNGDYELSKSLINDAISIIEKAGLDSFDYKIQKELLLFDISKEKDFSGLISLVEKYLDSNKQHDNMVQKIDLLITLAGLYYHSGNTDKFQLALDQVENLLSMVDPDDISKNLPVTTGFSAITFIQLRQREVRQLREYVKHK